MQYYFSGKDDVEIEKKEYYLGYIPEGYEEVERYENKSEIMIVYSNSEGKLLDLFYMDSSSNAHMFLNQTDAEKATVSGNSADFYESEDEEVSNDLVWIDEENGMLFSVSGFFSKEELIRIAESIQEREK